MDDVLCDEFARLSDACLMADTEGEMSGRSLDEHLSTCTTCIDWLRETTISAHMPIRDTDYVPLAAEPVPALQESEIRHLAVAGRRAPRGFRTGSLWGQLARYGVAMGLTAFLVWFGMSRTDYRRTGITARPDVSPTGAPDIASVRQQNEMLRTQVNSLLQQSRHASEQFECDKRTLQSELDRAEIGRRFAEARRRDAMARARRADVAMQEMRSQAARPLVVVSAALGSRQFSDYGFPDSLTVRGSGPRSLALIARLSIVGDTVMLSPRSPEPALVAVFSATGSRILERVCPRSEAAWEQAGEPIALSRSRLSGADRLIIVAVQAVLDDEPQTSARRAFPNTRDARTLVRALYDHSSQPRLATVQVALRR